MYQENTLYVAILISKSKFIGNTTTHRITAEQIGKALASEIYENLTVWQS
jgi:hypothetical protein